jgi:Rad3-related DNA helicase
MNIYTWQAIVLKVMATEDKKEYSNKTLVVDEAHGLYMDYNYKPAAIRNLINIFQYFKSVVIMSGTLDPNHITSFQLIDHMGSISLNKR